MKAKLVIAFVFLIMVCMSVASVEYKLVRSFGVAFDLFASVFAVFVLLGALLRAPEGYEDENGFHIVALADVVPLSPSQYIRRLAPFSLCARSSPRRFSNGSM